MAATAAVDPGLLAAELRARREFAKSLLHAGVWSLVAGEPDEGLEQLRRLLADPTGRGNAEWQRAEIAAIVGDSDRAVAEASAALPDAARYVPGWREYRSAMLALFADDEASAAASVDALDAAAATGDKLRSGQPSAVVAIPRGLLRGDAGEVARGLDAFLGWHLRRARSRSEIFNSARGVVSLDAIAALLLAHRRGIAVPVAAAYRKAKVPLLVIHLQEWKGEPLPRAMPLSIETDLVAGAWLKGRGVES